MPKTRSQQTPEPAVNPSHAAIGKIVDSSDDDEVVESKAEDANAASAVRVKREDEGENPEPNDQALEILSDLVEYEAEMMFWNRDERAQHWQSLEVSDCVRTYTPEPN